jgi:hypothetical protein
MAYEVMGFTHLDVQAIQPNLTDSEAEKALVEVSRDFRDRLTEQGYEILSDLLFGYDWSSKNE